MCELLLESDVLEFTLDVEELEELEFFCNFVSFFLDFLYLHDEYILLYDILAIALFLSSSLKNKNINTFLQGLYLSSTLLNTCQQNFNLLFLRFNFIPHRSVLNFKLLFLFYHALELFPCFLFHFLHLKFRESEDFVT